MSLAQAGIHIALTHIVMRASEIIILYLATAAPFGVAHFLGGQVRRRPAFLARAFAVAMLWPFAALLYVLKLKRRDAARRDGTDDDSATVDERKIERAKHALVNLLRETEELLERAGVMKGEAERHTLFAARESVERYAGLTLAAAGAHANAAPSMRELELCRIAGRTGEDLQVGGRCVHRRNAARLVAHRERARARVLHALTDVRELASDACNAPSTARTSARQLSERLLRVFACAIELHSLLDDWQAATAVARLLDAECARLRRLEAEESKTLAHAVSPEGGERCTPPILEASAL